MRRFGVVAALVGLLLIVFYAAMLCCAGALVMALISVNLYV